MTLFICGAVAGFGIGLFVWEIFNRKFYRDMLAHAEHSMDMAENCLRLFRDVGDAMTTQSRVPALQNRTGGNAE